MSKNANMIKEATSLLMAEKKSLLLKKEWLAILFTFLKRRTRSLDGVLKFDLNSMDQIELLNNFQCRCLEDLFELQEQDFSLEERRFIVQYLTSIKTFQYQYYSELSTS